VAFQRRFKTEANSTALEIRGELGLGALDPLEPRMLAQHLDIPIWTLTEMCGDAPEIKYLLTTEPEAFSAVTVFRGRERTIVHNDGHHPFRQNSNLAHELAHGLLQHPATPALDDKGCREWNQDIENEASWLAGILLVPESATIAIAQGKWTRDEASAHFQVSTQMIQFRLNATGAIKRVARSKNYRKR
jgi:Zn-dependent peptidase ImmA (M78 family)